MNIKELEYKSAEELREMVKDMMVCAQLKTDVIYYDSRFDHFLNKGFTQKEAFRKVEEEFSQYYGGHVYKNYESYRQGRRKRILNKYEG